MSVPSWLVYVAFFILALFLGCARPQRMITLPQVPDESQVLVACPDDGVHAVVDGQCVAAVDVPGK